MNALPLPLRLLISVVVIAALGFGSFFVVGAIVNPPVTPVSSDGVEPRVVPVLAPSSFGELADAEAPERSLEGEGSAEVGSIEIVTKGPDGEGSGSDFDAVLDAIAAGGTASEAPGAEADSAETDSAETDPVEDLVSGDDLGVYIVGGERLADPCAPVDGTAPADCPEGERSTVLALTRPAITVIGYPYPSITPAPGQPTCAWQDPAFEDVPFGVRTNTPSDIAVTYWPVADPSDVSTLSLRTPLFATNKWNSLIEIATEFAGPWTELDHCSVLTGLRLGTEYAYDVVATDDTGRSVAQPTGLFVAGETRYEPSPLIYPYLSEALIAVAPHRANEVVEIRAWWVDSLARVNNCITGPDLGGELSPVRAARTSEVSREVLDRNQYDLAFTRSTMTSFRAPEGSNIFVCIRWFDEDSPSWSRDRSLRTASTWLESPNQVVPTFTITAIGHDRRVGPNAAEYSIGTIEDEWCGGWTGPTAEEIADGRPWLTPERGLVCDGAELVGHNWTGDTVVLLSGRIDGGATQEIALDLGVDHCLGYCELPPTSRFRVQTVTAGGNPVSDMVIEVTWREGNQESNSWWTQRDLNYRNDDQIDPVFAQLDTDAELRLLDEGGRAGIQFDLRTDRAASFTARLMGDCSGRTTVREVRGSAPGDGTSQAVTFSDLCRGSVYWVEVQLTDAVGTTIFSPYVPTAVWSEARTSANWRGGRIEIEPVTLDLSVSVVVQPNPGDRVMEVEAGLVIGSRSVDLGLPEDGCIAAPLATGLISLDGVDLRENVRVLFTFRDDGEGEFVGGVASCNEGGARGEFMVVSQTVPLADLLAGTVRIVGGPDASYPYEITLRQR